MAPRFSPWSEPKMGKGGKGNQNGGKFCTICKKTNHNTDRCHFNPNKGSGQQANKYGNNPHQDGKFCNFCNRYGHVESECRSKSTHLGGHTRNRGNPKKNQICGWCGKKGHVESECRTRLSQLRNQSQNYNGEEDDDDDDEDDDDDDDSDSDGGDNNDIDPDSGRPYDFTQYCNTCSRLGHRYDSCHKANPLLEPFSSSSSSSSPSSALHNKRHDERAGQIRLRDIRADTMGGMGNAVPYEQPLRLVRREVFRSSWYQGCEHRVEAPAWYDDFLVDGDDDVLMCSCSGPPFAAFWCIHRCASNLFAQSGQNMWVSEMDRGIIEFGMVCNYVAAELGSG